MSDSVKHFPIVKDKNRFFQKYLNRKERRMAKQFIRRGKYERAEGAIIPHGDYDVTDYCFWYGISRDLPENPRERHKLFAK